jgi:hypothetical protein
MAYISKYEGSNLIRTAIFGGGGASSMLKKPEFKV